MTGQPVTSLNPGEVATFTVIAHSTKGDVLNYQWSKAASPTDEYSIIDDARFSGTTSATLTFRVISRDGGQRFRVKVATTARAEAISLSATIVISQGAGNVPTLTIDSASLPSTLSLATGIGGDFSMTETYRTTIAPSLVDPQPAIISGLTSRATLGVVATSDNGSTSFGYQWQKRAAAVTTAFTDISGATMRLYPIPSADLTGTGAKFEYRVLVYLSGSAFDSTVNDATPVAQRCTGTTNADISETILCIASKGVTTTAEAKSITITQQLPALATFATNSTLTLTAQASTNSYELLTYTWKKGVTAISSGDGISGNAGTCSTTNINTITNVCTITYTKANAQPADGGSYTVDLTTSAVTTAVPSTATTVTVTDALTNPNSLINITANGAAATTSAVTTYIGRAVSLAQVTPADKSGVYASSALTRQWQQCTTSCNTEANWADVTDGTGGTMASYTTASFTAAGTFQYRLKFSLTAVGANPALTLTSPVSAVVTVAAPFSISRQPANAASSATANFTVDITKSDVQTFNVDVQWQTSTNNGSTWSNVVGGTDGSVTNSSAASFTYTTATLANGNTGHQFRAVITRNGTSFALNSSAATFTFQNIDFANKPDLTTRVLEGSSGTLSSALTGCTGTTTASWVINNPPTVSRTTAASISVTTQPVDTVAEVGTATKLSITATDTGGGTISYQWQEALSNIINPQAADFENIPTATSSTLAISPVATTHNYRSYRVVMVSGASVATSDVVRLRTFISSSATSPITTQPVSLTTIASDATVTLSVVASGSNTYQWQSSNDNGGSWSNVVGGTGGTTASYTTGAITTNNIRYRVVITSGVNTTTSAESLVQLNTFPLTQATDLTGLTGANTTSLSFTLTVGQHDAATGVYTAGSPSGRTLTYKSICSSPSATLSGTTTLSVPPLINISTQPFSVAVADTNAASNTATYTAVVSAGGSSSNTYQWEQAPRHAYGLDLNSSRNGTYGMPLVASWTNVSGGTGATTVAYTTLQLDAFTNNLQQYRLKITNTNGATVRVKYSNVLTQAVTGATWGNDLATIPLTSASCTGSQVKFSSNGLTTIVQGTNGRTINPCTSFYTRPLLSDTFSTTTGASTGSVWSGTSALNGAAGISFTLDIFGLTLRPVDDNNRTVVFISYADGGGDMGFAYLPVRANTTLATADFGVPYRASSIIAHSSGSSVFSPLNGTKPYTIVWTTPNEFYSFAAGLNNSIRPATISGTTITQQSNLTFNTSSAASIQEVVASPDGNTILQGYGNGSTVGGVKQLDRANNAATFSDLGNISASTTVRGIAISPDGLSAILSNNASGAAGAFILLERTKLGATFALTTQTNLSCGSITVSGGSTVAPTNGRTVAISPDGLRAYLGCNYASAVPSASVTMLSRDNTSVSWSGASKTTFNFTTTSSQMSIAEAATYIHISPDNHSLAVIRGAVASATNTLLTYAYWHK